MKPCEMYYPIIGGRASSHTCVMVLIGQYLSSEQLTPEIYWHLDMFSRKQTRGRYMYAVPPQHGYNFKKKKKKLNSQMSQTLLQDQIWYKQSLRHIKLKPGHCVPT